MLSCQKAAVSWYQGLRFSGVGYTGCLHARREFVRRRAETETRPKIQNEKVDLSTNRTPQGWWRGVFFSSRSSCSLGCRLRSRSSDANPVLRSVERHSSSGSKSAVGLPSHQFFFGLRLPLAFLPLIASHAVCGRPCAPTSLHNPVCRMLSSFFLKQHCDLVFCRIPPLSANAGCVLWTMCERFPCTAADLSHGAQSPTTSHRTLSVARFEPLLCADIFPSPTKHY